MAVYLRKAKVFIAAYCLGIHIALALRSIHHNGTVFIDRNVQLTPAFIGGSCLHALQSSTSLSQKNDLRNTYQLHSVIYQSIADVGVQKDVRVRFAPSPTGDLHVGNLRTFIYNYLYARKHGGTLIFRVDDTDESREVDGSLSRIISDLKWLGFTWSEGPGGETNTDKYYQSKRQDAYKEVAELLLQTKKAYRCFCTKEEVKARKAVEEGPAMHLSYDKECRYLSQAQVTEKLLSNKEYTIRFCNLTDQEDFILIRSNGTATYNFACAVDDHSYGISHVIRGVDHLDNTTRQMRVLEAVGTALPTYVHCSLMHNKNHTKISKRSDDAVTISKLRDLGICKLPIVNYLAFLGTKYTDDPTCHGLGTISEMFDLDLLSRIPISFDLTKLLWLNRRYISALSQHDFTRQMETFFGEVSGLNHRLPKEVIMKIIAVAPSELKDGVDTMRDYVTLIDEALSYKQPRFVGANCYDYGGFFLQDSSQKFLETFVEWSQHLVTASELGQSLYELLKDMLYSEEFIAIDGKKHLAVVRYALTGVNHGPPITEMIDLWRIAEEQHIEGFTPLRDRLLNIRHLDLTSNDPITERLFSNDSKDVK